MRKQPATTHPLAVLRGTVLRALQEFSCGHRSYEQPEGASGAGRQETSACPAQAVSTLLVLIALRILDHAGYLYALSDEKQALAGSRPDHALGASELSTLACLLHRRFSAFCPEPIHALLPAPDPLALPQLERLWSLLSDERLSEQWSDERSLGYAYQFLCEPVRRSSLKEIQSANKSIGLDCLIAFTQLYTPAWVAEFLLQNTVLPQWSGTAACDQRTLEHYHLFDPLMTRAGAGCSSQAATGGRDQQAARGSLKTPLPNTVQIGITWEDLTAGAGKAASEIKLIDPACGAGHFLLPAFDLFLKMHEAEGTAAEKAVPIILEHNLAGVDIDGVALWVTALALLVKSIKAGAADNLRFMRLANVLAPAERGQDSSLLGTLDPRWSDDPGNPLSERYHVAVTNPPYLGRKLLPRSIKAELRALYPRSHQDLCAAFVERGIDMLEPGGRLGFITQASLLHLPTYRELRQRLVEQERLISVVEAGPGVFPLQSGEKINSTLIVVESARNGTPAKEQGSRAPAVFIDASNDKDKERALRQLFVAATGTGSPHIYLRDAGAFKKHPRYAFAYKCPAVILDTVHELGQLGSRADVRQGLATTDNQRFVRYWWDVAPSTIGKSWFPYVKGAGSERWYAPIMHVVNWANGGAAIKEAVARSYPYLKGKTGWVVKNEQFYFQEGLTFSFVNARNLAVRRLPAGCIFDVGGSSIFGAPEELDFLLAYLNSSTMAALARLLNPTINFQVGDIRRLPVLPFSQRLKEELAQLAQECYRLKRDAHVLDETSLDAVVPQELLDVASGASLERAWRSASSRLATCADRLRELELQVDALILDGLIRATGSDESNTRAIRKWLDEGRQTQPPKPALASQGELAHSVLHFLIRLRMERGSANWDQPSTCQLQHQIEDVPLILPMSDSELLCRALGLTSASGKWLAEHLGTSISQYLARQFMERHARRFRGHPAYFCLPLPDTNCLLLASTRYLRRRMAITLHMVPEDVADASTQNLLTEICAHLARIPDWTGANLLTVIAKLP